MVHIAAMSSKVKLGIEAPMSIGVMSWCVSRNNLPHPLSIILISSNTYILVWWKEGHCIIQLNIFSSSARSHKSHQRVEFVRPLSLTSSHFNRLHLQTIFTMSSHIQMSSGNVSDNCHQDRYLGVWHNPFSISRHWYDLNWMDQYTDSSSQALFQTISFHADLEYYTRFPQNSWHTLPDQKWYLSVKGQKQGLCIYYLVHYPQKYIALSQKIFLTRTLSFKHKIERTKRTFLISTRRSSLSHPRA